MSDIGGVKKEREEEEEENRAMSIPGPSLSPAVKSTAPERAARIQIT